ncbi:MAG: cytochrome c biogenesis protein CcdA [Candidatus Doudnabacteria bacterium]
MSQSVSLTVAFLGGVLTLLPACGPALLPAFFGFVFTEKQKLVLATVFFGLGFALVFFPFSYGFNFLVHLLIYSREVLFGIIGWLLVIFGLLSLFNFYLPLYSGGIRPVHKFWQTFFLGIIFGLTSSTCTAPIYGAILSLNSLSSGFVQVNLLLLSFMAGMIIPLLILAGLVEHYGLLNLSIFQKPVLRINVGHRIFSFFLGNLLAALVFIPLGFAFIVSKGGAPFLSFAQSTGILIKFETLNESLITYNAAHPHLDYWVLGLLLAFCLLLWLNTYRNKE